MTFEHFAFNVPDVRAQAAWWVKNLGLTVGRKRDDAPYTHFLADDTGRVFVELYCNPSAAMPDYRQMNPLVFHVAFVSTDVLTEKARLEKAEATFVLEDKLPDGTALLMMRDPWGVALQFCQRAKPF
jgi:catechol 2,3-dioxygenase-like lactoylglutathione lyase family enzyme